MRIIHSLSHLPLIATSGKKNAYLEALKWDLIDYHSIYKQR